MHPMTIRKLHPEDTAQYRELRLQALLEHPEAFGSSYEDEVEITPEMLAERWRAAGDNRMNFGVFDGDRLGGIVTLVHNTARKLSHRGAVVGMYVSPAMRGRGAGQALLEVLFDHGRERGIESLVLSVTAGNDGARRLYRRCGFITYGVEPGLIRTSGRDYDVELMWRTL